MKKTLKLMMFALLAFGMMACGEKQVTLDDLKQAELSVMNEDGRLVAEAVPAAVDQYCKFVKQNPDDPTAPEWLFKGMQLEMKAENADKAIALCEQLVNDYPDFDNNPAALVMLASEVYEGQLKDQDKALATYERVVNDYPESDWAKSAAKLIEFIGLSPEEILNRLQMEGMQVEEGEW